MATVNYGWANFQSLTLNGAIGTTDTTIAVSDASGLPNEGHGVIEPSSAANREIIYWTSKSSNNLVLPSVGAGRGQGGTSAVAHSSGVTFKQNTVAEMFEVLQDGSAMGLTFTGGESVLDNNKSYKVKNAAGTAKALIRLGTDDILRISQMRVQNDDADSITSSTVENVVIQSGWAQRVGSGTASQTTAITYPTAFTTILTLVCGPLSAKTTSAATAITDLTVGIAADPYTVTPDDITTTGFTATITRSGSTLANTNYYGLSWIAIGTIT